MLYTEWVGKLDKETGNTHSTVFHSIDVACSANELLTESDALIDRMSTKLNISCDDLVNVIVYLVALHDVGKFSQKFYNDLNLPIDVDPQNIPSSDRHWKISYALMCLPDIDRRISERMKIQIVDEDGDNLHPLDSISTRKMLYSAVAGHHGEPPKEGDSNTYDLCGVDALNNFMDFLDMIIPSPKSPIVLTYESTNILSWFLVNITTVCDWIGSNVDWFNYTPNTIPIADYWKESAEKARRAINEAGIIPCGVSDNSTMQHLFGIETPRHMQQIVENLKVDQQMVAIIEDTTGSGKTEAGILLAHKLMRAGLGDGVYVALPTQATANGLFSRMASSYRKMFNDNTSPSIALAHGKRKLNKIFRQTRYTPKSNTHGNAAYCSDWISSESRRVFMSDVGVGTIDQLFLSILPVKWAALRLFGMSRQVIIIDEAHACDPYMQEELYKTVQMQALMGGSVIIMTATLASEQKNKIVQSFINGIDPNLPPPPPVTDSYPSLTIATRDNVVTTKIEPSPSAIKKTPITHLSSEDEALDIMRTSANNGACSVWIRNTVKQAMDVASKLSNEGYDVTVFHSRFCVGDRSDKELATMRQFGKESSQEERRGKILIATQVVEQSLDIDFDVMVTDIAPIDSLIQRVGRLWRHNEQRPNLDRGGAQYKLYILSPDYNDISSENWIENEVFKSSVFIYGVGNLWRTARAIFTAGEIDAPYNIPNLIESVVGKIAPEIPSELTDAEADEIGAAFAARGIARRLLITPEDGYRDGILQDEKNVSTRLGDSTYNIMLVKLNLDGSYRYYYDHDKYGDYSELTVPLSVKRRLDDVTKPDKDMIRILTDGWKSFKFDNTIFIEVQDGGVIYEDIAFTISYDPKIGLIINESTD